MPINNPFSPFQTPNIDYSPFTQWFSSGFPVPPIIPTAFKLLDTDFFHLLNGEQFQLLGP